MMLNFLLVPSRILAFAAIVPAVIILIRIYKEDRLERESPRLIASLVLFGVLSTVVAILGERLGDRILGKIFAEETVLCNAIMYFIVVGISEEGAKWLILRWRTWKSKEFNCRFDGIVYAVTVSLGFALWENLSYVFRSAIYGQGMQTALLRAVTAVPGHACFGVFMGLFYGEARKLMNEGDKASSSVFSILSVFVPVVIHGSYDFLATYEDSAGIWGMLAFWAFVAALFALSWLMIRKTSQKDRYI